jgi:hypothetical protein
VPFYQTNPPILGWEMTFIVLQYNGLRRENLSRNGGFVLENEPTGRGFWRGIVGNLEVFFAGKEGAGDGADAMAWRIHELMKASGYL